MVGPFDDETFGHALTRKRKRAATAAGTAGEEGDDGEVALGMSLAKLHIGNEASSCADDSQCVAAKEVAAAEAVVNAEGKGANYGDSPYLCTCSRVSPGAKTLRVARRAVTTAFPPRRAENCHISRFFEIWG